MAIIRLPKTITARPDFLDILNLYNIPAAYYRSVDTYNFHMPKNFKTFLQDIIHMLKYMNTQFLMEHSPKEFTFAIGTYFLCDSLYNQSGYLFSNQVNNHHKNICDIIANANENFSFLKLVILRKKQYCETHYILVKYIENNTAQQFYLDEEWYDSLDALLKHFYVADRPVPISQEMAHKKFLQYGYSIEWELAKYFPDEPFYYPLNALGAEKMIMNEDDSEAHYLFVKNEEISSPASANDFNVTCCIKLNGNFKEIPLVCRKKENEWTFLHVDIHQEFTSIKSCVNFIRKQAGVLPLISFSEGDQPLLSLTGTDPYQIGFHLWKGQYYLLRMLYPFLKTGKIPYEKVIEQSLLDFLSGFNAFPFKNYIGSDSTMLISEKDKSQFAIDIIFFMFEIRAIKQSFFEFYRDENISNLIREFAEWVMNTPTIDEVHLQLFANNVRPYLPDYLRDYYNRDLQKNFEQLIPTELPFLQDGNEHAQKIRRAQQQAIATCNTLFAKVNEQMIAKLNNVEEIQEFLKMAKQYQLILGYFINSYDKRLYALHCQKQENYFSFSTVISRINNAWKEIKKDSVLLQFLTPDQRQLLLGAFKNLLACLVVRYIAEAPSNLESHDKNALFKCAQEEVIFSTTTSKSSLLQDIFRPAMTMIPAQLFEEAKKDLAAKAELKNNVKSHEVAQQFSLNQL